MLAAVDEYKSFSLSPSEASLGGNTLRCTLHISEESFVFTVRHVEEASAAKCVKSPQQNETPLLHVLLTQHTTSHHNVDLLYRREKNYYTIYTIIL